MTLTRDAALELDKKDPLAEYRERFYFPDKEIAYLDGNSLGRLPLKTVEVVNTYLQNEWGSEVVDGWAHWIDEAQITGDLIGRAALGAASGQVLACDTTSVNFYQLCAAVIKARPDRKTIITDQANFPTDRYILQGLADAHDMKLVMIDNETTDEIKNEQITPQILKSYLNDDVALVSLEVIQYRSGARSEIKALTDLVRAHGALLVWDASHAVGAIDLDFDANGVDLAVGCTYKYGNSGPGSPAWLYVRKSIQNQLRVPIQGWFAQADQFEMGADFEAIKQMRRFQIASPSIIGLRCVNTAFEMIAEAKISEIAKKAAIGTDFMIELHDQWLKALGFELRTPRGAIQRGGHISLWHPEAKRISFALRKYAKVIPDYRVPNQIRLAISPLPTSYLEVFEGFERIKDSVIRKDYEKIDQQETRVT